MASLLYLHLWARHLCSVASSWTQLHAIVDFIDLLSYIVFVLFTNRGILYERYALHTSYTWRVYFVRCVHFVHCVQFIIACNAPVVYFVYVVYNQCIVRIVCIVCVVCNVCVVYRCAPHVEYIPQTVLAQLRGSYLLCIVIPLEIRIPGRQPRYLSLGT